MFILLTFGQSLLSFTQVNLCLGLSLIRFQNMLKHRIQPVHFAVDFVGDVSILHGCLVTLATCALGLVGSYLVLLPNGKLCKSRLFVIND